MQFQGEEAKRKRVYILRLRWCEDQSWEMLVCGDRSQNNSTSQVEAGAGAEGLEYLG